ncbi:MAG: diguanylate cyclase [Rhodocyclaceae bacterium]|nr:diguanylate cyclase [Rhodocyclaceae bacterium]MBX3671238.1 diguanylate cyclase [Rhodocyclaceae bacterium]
MTDDTRIQAALFRKLVDDAALPLAGSVLASALVAAAVLAEGRPKPALAWFCVVVVTAIVRGAIVVSYRRALQAANPAPQRITRYALSVGLSGLAWGSGGLLVLHASPLTLTIVLTAVQAMVMGGTPTLAASMPAFLAFAIPAILPMIAALLSLGSDMYVALAGYQAIFLALGVLIARRYNRTLCALFRLGHEKEDLLKSLSEAHEQQAALAVTDPLTGIANRRRFDAVLGQEFARLKRAGAPLSLLLLDVDHFKSYNDSYGHQAGDRCLIEVAAVLQANMQRPADLAARYGGEEFAAILPETDQTGALQVAERIRARIQALGIPHRGSLTAAHLTASFGVATIYCYSVRNPAELIELADQQLYRAKAGGRNQAAAASAQPRGGATPARLTEPV